MRQWISGTFAVLGIACALGFSLVSVACAGGAGGLRRDAPDYAASLRNQIAWDRFPLQVFFERDKNYRPDRQACVVRGMERWTAATHGFVRFEQADSRTAADVVVRFDPSSNDGYTTTHFTNGEITTADVRVGVKRGSSPDMEAIASHEFGHVLGIDGHSSDKGDLMYPVHRMGAPYRVSARDLNTLARIYPQVREQIATRSTR
jgi:hypothetical protein